MALVAAKQFAAEIQARCEARATVANKPCLPLGEWLPTVSPEFNWNWPHLQYIREHLESHARGELRNLMVLCPPQHGKTQLVTVRYPLWRLEQNNALRVVISAYNQTYVEKIARAARRIATHRNVLPFAPDRNAAAEWELTTGGSFKAVGIGGGVTGNPAELAIIDDPIKGREEAESPAYREKTWEWYVDELSTRIQQDGQKLLVLTPWHEDDLRGRILNSSEAKSWTVIRLPAIAEENDPLGRMVGAPLCPERRSLKWLEEQKALSAYSFQSLYQCSPTAREGSFFKVANIEIVDAVPAGIQSARAWDIAATANDGDYTVGVRMEGPKNGLFYITNVQRGQWSTDDRDKHIKLAAQLDGVGTRIHIPQDPGAAGKSLAQSMVRMLAGYAVTASPVSGQKEIRADPFSSQLNAGNVRLLKGSWNAEVIEELRQFPNGRHDDIVDAASDAFGMLAAKPTRKFEIW